MEINYFILSFLAYLFGSLPFAYIVPKIFGFGDIRNIGSGNVGATNVLRIGNKSLAITVLILDILKGFLPFFILISLYEEIYSEYIIVLISSSSVIGHIFPIWLKFKGGKGVATFIGLIFSINYFLGIFFLAIWLIVAVLTRYSSLSSIVSLFFIPIIAIFFSFEVHTINILIILGLMIIIKHFSNIKRLINKNESKISF